MLLFKNHDFSRLFPKIVKIHDLPLQFRFPTQIQDSLGLFMTVATLYSELQYLVQRRKHGEPKLKNRCADLNNANLGS